MATGSHSGSARTADELRADLEMALALLPGSHCVNLHAMYAETGGHSVKRNELQPSHFENWIGWAIQNGLGLDFNGTYFSHPLASDGFTLSSIDSGIRQFWIEHGIACREIGAVMGRMLESPCIVNIWFPDGYKDTPVDRATHRRYLERSLDAILSRKMDPALERDALESKLFGIRTESYVAGSHDFCLAYALSRKIMLCLDMGHFHPTEQIADKISAIMPFTGELLLHLSRPVRWDSDHVVALDDNLITVFQEIVRGGYLGGVHLAMDFFDASINRVAAWVIGGRNALKALLSALLEPIHPLRSTERQGDLTLRLAMTEELKCFPAYAVWDWYCLKNDVPVGLSWLPRIRDYEQRVLANRSDATGALAI